ncbi:MAG: TonB-dependent receptor [bacterium]
MVRDQDGRGVAHAVVVVSWSDFDVDRATAVATPKTMTANVAADSLGVYRACGLPVARALMVQAQSGVSAQSGVLEEQIGPVGVLVRDYRVASSGTGGRAAAAEDSAGVVGRYYIAGRVVNADGAPVSSASVQLFGTAHATRTLADGTFRLAGLNAGTLSLEVIALGYSPRRLRAEVGSNTPEVTVRLERAAAVLDSMRVTAARVNSPQRSSYPEFDGRLKNAQGKFITEARIDSERPFLMTDLFRNMPGLKVQLPRTASGDAILVSTHATGFGSGCQMNIFIDGIQVGQTDLNLLNPSMVHGIEVYDVSTTPVKYAVRRNCGVVLIWTK